MLSRDQWHLVLQNLEFLAGGWELTGHAGPAADLRTMLMAYLEPELKVWYFYAAEWRIGTLLLAPFKDRAHWQIQRDEVGAMIDQVYPSADRIRIYVDGTNAPGR